MSTYPHPLGSVLPPDPPDPPEVPGPDKWHKDAERSAELKEHAEMLHKLRELVQKSLDYAKEGLASTRARALIDVRAGLLKGDELRQLQIASHQTTKFLEKFEKYMRHWEYGELSWEVVSAKPGDDRNKALEKLGYTILKNNKAPLVRFAEEIAHLPKGLTAKEFLEKILGKAAVLGIEAYELPLRVFVDVVTPTETAKDDVLLGPNGYYAKQQQAKCKELIDKGASADKVHACMADLLAIQRGENPQQPRVKKRKPLHLTIHPVRHTP